MEKQYPPPYGHDVGHVGPGDVHLQQGPPVGMPIVHQPQAHTTVVVNQTGPPAKGNLPGAAPQNIRNWDTGLCGCCEDISSCCYGYWCSWCMLCGIAGDMGEHCCLSCCDPPAALYGARIKFRAMYGIEGTMCGDACTTYCCFSLALCQLKRQMDTYKKGGAGLQTNVHIHHN